MMIDFQQSRMEILHKNLLRKELNVCVAEVPPYVKISEDRLSGSIPAVNLVE